MINRFSGGFAFLSNFFPSPLVVNGIKYPTVEHAFQASKTLVRQEKQVIAYAATPGQAKRMGRRLNLRPDWVEVKVDVMRELVCEKFRDSKLKAKLLATGHEELIEGNTWGDTFWGVHEGMGQNQLGKVLMEVRAEWQAQLKD